MVIKKLSLKADAPQELKRTVIDMRITKVSVENLFGRFNHTIELKLEEHITIIHSPNGLGKTVLLKMLFNLFHRNYEAISEIPFDKFRIDLDTDSYILCEKGSGTEQFRQGRLFDSPLDKVSPNKTKIVLTACKSGGNEEKFTPVFYPDDRSALRYLALRADSIGFDRVSSQMWRNAETAEIISTSELVVRLRRIYPDLDFGDFSVEPKLLTVFLQSVPIH